MLYIYEHYMSISHIHVYGYGTRPGEKETYKYLGILEADTIKQEEMKEKIQKEYFKRTRMLLEAKLCRRKLIKGINTRAVLS